jgi:pilus assembly protein Flp/PilA
MKKLIKALWNDEQAQDLVDYALLVALVALGTVTAMGCLASAISDAFKNPQTNLASS